MIKLGKPLATGDSEIELHPDAWERFERAVDTVLKGGPQHCQRLHDTRKERPALRGAFIKGNRGTKYAAEIGAVGVTNRL